MWQPLQIVNTVCNIALVKIAALSEITCELKLDHHLEACERTGRTELQLASVVIMPGRALCPLCCDIVQGTLH